MAPRAYYAYAASLTLHSLPRLDASELSAYWLPFTANRAFKQRPRLIDRAEGMHYYTPDGRRLLDAMSGLWCCNAGHCREAIVEAIRQPGRPARLRPRLPGGPCPRFSPRRALAKLAPGELDHVFFCNSGSEAVDSELKIALAYHKLAGASTRTRFVSRERSYHGSCFGGTSVGGMRPTAICSNPARCRSDPRHLFARPSLCPRRAGLGRRPRHDLTASSRSRIAPPSPR